MSGVDHCTAFPDHLGSLDWSACCARHDAAYGLGLDKLGADLDLATCVAAVGGWPMAIVMLIGVTVFGLPFWISARSKR